MALQSDDSLQGDQHPASDNGDTLPDSGTEDNSNSPSISFAEVKALPAEQEDDGKGDTKPSGSGKRKRRSSEDGVEGDDDGEEGVKEEVEGNGRNNVPAKKEANGRVESEEQQGEADEPKVKKAKNKGKTASMDQKGSSGVGKGKGKRAAGGAAEKKTKAKGGAKMKEKTKSENNEVDNSDEHNGLMTPPPGSENPDKKLAKPSMPQKSGSLAPTVWTSVEDALISTLYLEQKKPWQDIADAINLLPGCAEQRNARQCKNRWHHVLKHPYIQWTDEETTQLKILSEAMAKDPYAWISEQMNAKFAEKKFSKAVCEKKMKELRKSANGE
ncbi:hypothetical protein BDZ91DRAFT_790911 [Kalaharituber pfeilii]|nr:hypothetical protein BDZ91DRAFT_790911 [Kalaharituber pfeilii]